MERGNLLTGAQYINLDYYPTAEKATLGTFMQYTTIPTIETGLAQIEEKVTSILNTIDALPLADTVASLNQNLESLESILDNQSTQQLPTHLDQTVQELRDLINSLSPNSDASQTLNSSLLSLSRTLANLESLTGKLSRQPSAVIFPSSPEVDPIPEVSEQ
jgi:paraquat-inducible protein B